MPLSPRRARILVVDDEEDMVDTIRQILVRAGHEVIGETDARRALELLAEQRPDLMLSDLRMPGLDGLALLDELASQKIEVPVVVVTGHATVESAVEAMKRGAVDYLAKPFSPDELLVRVEKHLSFQRLSEENRLLRERLSACDRHGVVGDSPELRDVLKLVEKVAPTDSRVLIVGESGTGKELIARTIHCRGPRADAAFFAVNCGAFAEGVLESELFGHERGAFTGAFTTKKGIFEIADGGTLFLDEISETTPALQTRLLRVLQEGEFLRVGGTRPIQTDVRILASTNRDPRKAIEEGRLREDLFYRLAVVQIVLPPLRERASDIPLLTTHFIDLYSRHIKKPVRGIAQDALAALMSYPWPGNCRELENVVERAIIMAEKGEAIALEDLPAELATHETPPELAASAAPMQEVRDAEREVLLRTLRECNWNRSLAAKRLGIGRRTLYDKLARHGISLKPSL